MIIRKQGQDRKQTGATIGFWAALLTATLNVWYLIAFGLYQPILLAPWHGLAAYAASFQPLPLMAWPEGCCLPLPLYFWLSCFSAASTKQWHSDNTKVAQ